MFAMPNAFKCKLSSASASFLLERSTCNNNKNVICFLPFVQWSSIASCLQLTETCGRLPAPCAFASLQFMKMTGLPLQQLQLCGYVVYDFWTSMSRATNTMHPVLSPTLSWNRTWAWDQKLLFRIWCTGNHPHPWQPSSCIQAWYIAPPSISK